MKRQEMGPVCWTGVFFLLASAGAASAKDCVQSQPTGVAVVVGAGRAYFHDDADLCPARKAYCLQRTYVIAKDRVLTGVSHDGYTCVFAASRNATTSGWIETKRLGRKAVTPTSPPSAWEGGWESEGIMNIKVWRSKHGLQASGIEDWNSGDGYDDNGNIGLPGRHHHSEFSGRLSAVDNRARLKNGECHVEFTLLDEFMMVEDDTSCGDGNSSLSGIYRRKP